MRFELSGSLVHPNPLVIVYDITQSDSDPHFDTQKYIDMGYTHFDVICIGGGGGAGGGIDTNNTGTLVRNYGGAGGGGGFHRTLGLLSALALDCPIVIGDGGAVGTNHVSDPNLTTDGGDGEPSSFNDTTCRASGGKGGKRAKTNSTSVTTQADGGEGGRGDRIIAGGGAAGGVAGIGPQPPDSATPATPGEDGTLFQNIGEGGGGGSGGIGKYPTGQVYMKGTAGGRGAYNPGDTSVYGPGSDPGDDAASASKTIVPGGASGAKASPVNGLPTVYGQSKSGHFPGDPGVVIIRLTAQ